MPRGFAHGFLALSKRVQLLYQCSDFYDGADEQGVGYDDPDLSITWGITSLLLSEKDKSYRPLAKIPWNCCHATIDFAAFFGRCFAPNQKEEAFGYIAVTPWRHISWGNFAAWFHGYCQTAFYRWR